MNTRQDLLDCSRCGEDACLVEWDGLAMVRVRRKARCAEYRPSQGSFGSPTCRTNEHSTTSAAVAEWNSRQANGKDQV